MKINRHDQAKILPPQEIAWLFDGKVELVSNLELLRLLVWSGKGEGMEAGASLLPEVIASLSSDKYPIEETYICQQRWDNMHID